MDTHKLYCHFKSLNATHCHLLQGFHLQPSYIPHLDEAITYNEVLQAIKKLKTGNSAGANGIPGILGRYIYKSLIPDQILHLLYNCYFKIQLPNHFFVIDVKSGDSTMTMKSKK